MAAAQDMNTAKLSAPEKLNEIIQKNRRYIFIGLIAIIVLLVSFIIVQAVIEKMQ